MSSNSSDTRCLMAGRSRSDRPPPSALIVRLLALTKSSSGRPAGVSTAIEELRAILKRLPPVERGQFCKLACGLFAEFLDADTDGKLAEALDRNRRIKRDPDREELLKALRNAKQDQIAAIVLL